MTECPSKGQLVEERIDRILTQYRESPKLIGLLRTLLGQVEEVARSLCSLPSFFDLDTAVGDQLSLLGKRLGFPRCHCICALPRVFGFACGGAYNGPYEISGFCEDGSWIDCRDTGTADICIDDDEIYRNFLRARRYQALGMYDAESLLAAARWIWGETASVSNLGGGKVAVSPGRALSAIEDMLKPVAFRVLPIAPGVKALVSNAVGSIAGFGSGWFGFCENANWLCPSDPHTYDCA